MKNKVFTTRSHRGVIYDDFDEKGKPIHKFTNFFIQIYYIAKYDKDYSWIRHVKQKNRENTLKYIKQQENGEQRENKIYSLSEDRNGNIFLYLA